jgi:hypothetical protein
MKKKKLIKKISTFSAICISSIMLASCSLGSNQTQNNSDTDTSLTNTGEATTPIDDVIISSEDTNTERDINNENIITLNSTTISYTGNNAVVNGSIITIKDSGDFYFKGNLTNGQIIVDADSEDEIRLIFDGVDINCSNSSPVNIKKAKKVTILLEENSENILTDGNSYVYDDVDNKEPNSTIFSKADLTINGSGKLTVNANFNNAIISKDTLIITGGNFVINSIDDGIIGKDSLIISNSKFNIKAGGDGLRSTNDSDTISGYILIESGEFTITAGNDGLQAANSILIKDGIFELKQAAEVQIH